MRKYLLTIGAMLGLAVGAAQAAEFKPAVVFDMGGKFDKSFNEGVYNGVEKFRKETGIKYREFEVTNTTQREQALRRMAQRGAGPGSGRRFRPGPGAREGRQGISECPLHHHRFGGRLAERAVGDLQGA